MRGKTMILCSAMLAAGFLASEALHAQQGMQRTELKRADLTGVSGTEVIMGILEVPPGATVPRHFHHGDEISYVLEGATVEPPGQAPTTLKTGSPIHYPREVVHGGAKVVGNTPLKLLTVHIVDKGKPLMEEAK